MTEDELYQKLQNDLAAEIQRNEEAKKRVPTSFRIGPRTTLRESAEHLAVETFKQLRHNRHYALSSEGRLELAALAVACTSNKKNLTNVLEVLASVEHSLKDVLQEKEDQRLPGLLQLRPAADAGTVPELPIDKATGLRCRNAWLPLPPREGETQPRFDHASQHVIRETSPRLAKWLEDCAKNDGLPSVAMLDELESERIEAEHLRKIPYGEKEWQENLLRPDSGANPTERGQFIRNTTDPWLARLHTQEAKGGSPRLRFDNHTFANLLYKRDPAIREIHRKAGELFATWKQEAKQKAAA